MSDIYMKVFSLNVWKSLRRHLFATIIQTATIIIVARFYGTEGNGIFAMVFLLPYMLVSFLTMGLESSNIYLIGKMKTDVNEVFISNFWFGLLLSTIGVVLGALVIIYGSKSLFPNINKDLLWIALACYPGLLMQKLTSSVLQGMQKYADYNFVSLISPFLLFFFSLMLLLNGVDDLLYLISANFIAIYSSFVITIFITKSYLAITKQVNVKAFLSAAIKYGYKVHVANILSFINYKADLLIVNMILNPLSTGIYVVAVQISERLWLFSQALSVVLFPTLSSMKGNESMKIKFTFISCQMVFCITMIGSFFLSAVSYFLIDILFGLEYIDAVTPLIALQPGIVALAVSRVISNDIAARGAPELNMYSSMIVVVINILVNFLLIPIWGLVGAAIATSVAYIVNLIFRIVIYKHLTNCSLKGLFVFRLDNFRFLKTTLSN